MKKTKRSQVRSPADCRYSECPGDLVSINWNQDVDHIKEFGRIKMIFFYACQLSSTMTIS
jgi:hypothetical protein